MHEEQSKGLNVLVVDDDRIVGMLHRMVLVRSQFCTSPIVCEKGSEALRHILEGQESGKAWLVFLDLHMPQMTGWEFLNALMKHTTKEPVNVVIASSSVDSSDLTLAQDYPMVLDFLSKPLSTKRLDKLRLHPALSAYFPA